VTFIVLVAAIMTPAPGFDKLGTEALQKRSRFRSKGSSAQLKGLFDRCNSGHFSPIIPTWHHKPTIGERG
jgi:hypothetical protein